MTTLLPSLRSLIGLANSFATSYLIEVRQGNPCTNDPRLSGYSSSLQGLQWKNSDSPGRTANQRSTLLNVGNPSVLRFLAMAVRWGRFHHQRPRSDPTLNLPPPQR
ncbi:hypothetical protein B0T17DRAFT_231805 [Bombardia bombarda]|uniref:Uncharacterized protein n=1 Tax=Bombardia bombarda TaxID=252184 RepID=A0AA39XBC2_9PEZI|nr:hypothetical protein B0T17DRAFT_231805 [Bombardia bombarda]